MASSTFDLHPASRRIYVIIAGIGVLGSAAAWWRYGWRGALGLAAGAAVSAWNYGRLEHLADAITAAVKPVADTAGAPPPPPSKRRALRQVLLTALRYALVLAALYVIVKILEANLIAALAGLFAGFIAVFANALWEMIADH